MSVKSTPLIPLVGNRSVSLYASLNVALMSFPHLSLRIATNHQARLAPGGATTPTIADLLSNRIHQHQFTLNGNAPTAAMALTFAVGDLRIRLERAIWLYNQARLFALYGADRFRQAARVTN